MIKYLKKEKWSPYVVGVLIGLLSFSTFFLYHKTLGTSTTFVRLAALIWNSTNPSHLENNTYYVNTLSNHTWIDWQCALVFGIFIGAFLAGKMSGSSHATQALNIWENRFGKKPLKRSFAAFIGGIILLFGARLAGGCTSGHAIAGGMQMALTSWIFMLGLFAIGVPTAWMLYKSTKG